MPLYSPNPKLLEINSAAYMPMGLTGEQVAREFKVSRQQQDEFALRSNVRAKQAVESGLFDEEIVPIDVEYEWVDDGGRVQHQSVTFKRDEGPRATSMEALGKLKPAFQNGGTVTAGNSSQRSDGAAAVVVMERASAERRGIQPLARFVGFAVAGVRQLALYAGERGVRLAIEPLNRYEAFLLNRVEQACAFPRLFAREVAGHSSDTFPGQPFRA